MTTHRGEKAHEGDPVPVSESESGLKSNVHSLLEALDDFIVIVNTSEQILHANAEVARLTGHSLEELVGSHVSKLFPPETYEELSGLIQGVGSSQQVQCTISLLTRDAKKIPVDSKVSGIQWDGQDARMILSRDIRERERVESARERLETTLRQAQKMEALGTLAGGIAHDFNNILGGIFGYAEMALEESEPGSPVEDYLRHVLLAGKRAKDLVEQILTFSRQTDQEKKPVRIGPVVKEVVRLLRASIPSTIAIKRSLADHDHLVLADATQIHQVLMNLCTNAYHAMQENGGTLSIAVGTVELAAGDKIAKLRLAPGKYVVLEISDTGCGMSKAVMERIHEPYFTTKEQGKGTGLGLAVVHGIIQSHNGEISVYSEEGVGTTFRVYLPATASDLPKEAAWNRREYPMGKERILLVDDEKMYLEMMSDMLHTLGYTVVAIDSGLAAKDYFEQHPQEFDCLVTDMTMPGMTGVQLARRVLQIRPEFPIVLATGFSELVTKEQALAIGIKTFVMKPLVKKAIAEAIRDALDS